MVEYLVTPESQRIPPLRVTAADEVDLGHQVAIHLVRHKALRPGSYDAQIGDGAGAITQTGLLWPVRFSIRKEA